MKVLRGFLSRLLPQFHLAKIRHMPLAYLKKVWQNKCVTFSMSIIRGGLGEQKERVSKGLLDSNKGSSRVTHDCILYAIIFKNYLCD